MHSIFGLHQVLKQGPLARESKILHYETPFHMLHIITLSHVTVSITVSLSTKTFLLPVQPSDSNHVFGVSCYAHILPTTGIRRENQSRHQRATIAHTVSTYGCRDHATN